MEPIHPYQHQQHQHTVKHKYPNLAAHQVPIISFDELNHPEQTPHPDQNSCDVECREICLPPYARFQGFRGGVSMHSNVEHRAYEDETTEEEELNEKTPNDDFFAHFAKICNGHETTT
ncbi:hypothetical protein FDENT_13962 [Fusarium denticulatum]|uniref:Uncharacterized protein n=1 Tax=Fusarium denticulatum TaxID=48507 RepID=A0A8H5SX56_9HYPO|nr:hypothetical protein FDENT_13962 [Fusarium denticulatum]